MGQITIRATDELIATLKRTAAEEDLSMNEFVVAALKVATDATQTGTLADKLRARMRAAGILADMAPNSGAAPDAQLVAAAALRAGQGTPLSEFIATARAQW